MACCCRTGVFAPRMGNNPRLGKLFKTNDADVVSVRIDPELTSGCEKVRVTADEDIVGFQRIYRSAVWPETCLQNRPHCVHIKSHALNRLTENGRLPLDFEVLLERARRVSLKTRYLRVGGDVQDLQRQDELLSFLTAHIASPGRQPKLEQGARLFGPVVVGRGVRIGAGAIVVGPTILNDHVTIGANAVIRSSVIGEGISTPEGCRLENRIILDRKDDWCSSMPVLPRIFGRNLSECDNRVKTGGAFCAWPRFSYAGLFKRLFDFCFAAVILLLCAPVLVIIAAVIKLTSRGPVFFAHRRQGLHGKEFNCVKFRTMIANADHLQDLVAG